MSDAICECISFEEGDWVESRLNSSIFGIIINESDFGRYYHVQLAGSLEVKAFYAVTLRHMDFSEDEPPTLIKGPSTDVIDFMKERALRKSTKTRGAA
jgi:hypothetical protein